MPIVKRIDELIGQTPMIELPAPNGARILAKLESFNPGGSIKDRIALAMISAAERDGKLQKGSTIIEPTSGSTGIGLAMIAAARGYKTIIVMPDTMSVERQLLLKAYGAQVVLTDGKMGMQGSIDKANELAAEIPGSWIPGQFDNPFNPLAHLLTTGPEILEATDGQADIFVAGVGTGGTLTGIGQYLKSIKKLKPVLQVVAVEPAESPLLSQGHAGSHGIQGIGANFVPQTLKREVIDEVLTVASQDAMTAGRELARQHGILAGISSGANYHAARLLAQRTENAGKTIITVFPDTGERYLSTAMFQDE